jgi:hypothetical protein
MKQFNINSDIVVSLLDSLFKPSLNSKKIISVMTEHLNSDQINHILTLNAMTTEYHGFNKGDVVRVPMVDYHMNEKFHVDVLTDLNLIPQIGYVYGIVYDDDNWGTNFNGYAAQLKVNLVYHDENKKPILHDYSVNSLYLIKEESDQDFFNNYYKELLHG